MLATAAAAGAFHCRPQPGLGSIALARGGALYLVELANCRERVLVQHGVEAPVRFVDGGRAVLYGGRWRVSVAGGRPRREPATAGLVSADGRYAASVRASGRGVGAKETIWVTNRRSGSSRPVSTFSESPAARTNGAGPLWLLGWSSDDRTLFVMVDPDSSASIAADGLLLRALTVSSGSIRPVAFMLSYPDYLGACGGKLVVSAGGDRIATDHKSLLVAAPPDWHTRPLVRAAGASWGTLACAPNGGSLVAQRQRSSTVANFFATRWALWRVGLDGSAAQLTAPPAGYADGSPRFSTDGRSLLFVRSRNGVGSLYLLRGATLVGPLLALGYQLGYYGHQDWWQTADWSDAAPG